MLSPNMNRKLATGKRIRETNIFNSRYLFIAQNKLDKIQTKRLQGYGQIQQTTKIFLLFPTKKQVWHFMQIVSLRDNLHEMSNLLITISNGNYNNCKYNGGILV